MALLLITYDLNAPGQKYQRLYEVIESLGQSFHPLDSTWFVKTNHDTAAVLRKMQSVLDDNDKVYVVDVTGQAANWTSFGPEGDAFLGA